VNSPLLFRREILAGATLTIIGGAFAVTSHFYDVGTPRRMGPGFFPMVVGVLLAAIGLVLMLRAGHGEDSGDMDAFRRPDARALVSIVAGIVAFIGLAENAGLAPATAASVFLSAFSDRAMTLRGALLLTLAITVASVGLFHYGLHLQLPVITGWF
jgi:hypothetical protein